MIIESVYSMTRDEYYDSLYHHGIMKQKWGVRHGPPYPLTYSKHSSAQKKSNPKSVIDGKEETTSKNQNSVSDTKEEHKGLTDKQKKAILIGAGITAGVLAAYGGVRIYKKYTAKAVIDTLTGLPKKTIDKGVIDDVKVINPGLLKKPFGFIDAIKGSHQNCVLCTTAYDMRRRGFDVHAGLSKTGFMEQDVALFYKNCTVLDWYKPKKSTIVDLEKDMLLKYPEGSRGNMFIQYSPIFGGGRHSVAFEVKNGKILIQECQAKKPNQTLAQTLKYCDISATNLFRTDDKDLAVDRLVNNKYIRTTNNTKFMVDNSPQVAFNVLTDPDVMLTTISSAYLANEVIKNNKQKNSKKENNK